MPTFDIPESKCPACEHTLSACELIEGEESAPEPGDHTVCGYCGSILVFETDLTFSRTTVEQVVLEDPALATELSRLQSRVRFFQASKG